jgi:hypothetical protein
MRQARVAGQLLHAMTPAAKELAAVHGLYTTTAPRWPGTRRDYLRAIDQERAHDRIANRLAETMADVPEFAGAVRSGCLGVSLANAFGTVLFVDAQDVHYADVHVQRNRIQGIAVASNTIFTVSSEANARRLAAAWQGLLRKPQGVHPVYIGRYGDGWPAVEVVGINEHTVRSVGRAVGALVEREDRAAGITLPPTKWPLSAWKSLLHETFPPALEDRLLATNEGYRGLGRIATYRHRPDLFPLTRKELIGTDAAPVFQTLRDIMNGLIWSIQGRYAANTEQHPDKDQRPMIELGVELTRDPIRPGEERFGPPSSRTLSAKEKAMSYGLARLVHARTAPLPVVLELAGSAFSGLPELIITGVRYGVAMALEGRQLLHDLHSYHQAQEAAWAGGRRIDQLVTELTS